MTTLEELASAVERGKKKEALPLLRQALDEGLDPQVILTEGLVRAMDKVGELFSQNEIFIPEMMLAARAMAACTDELKPALYEAGGAQSLGKGLIATVQGDMHDIGKNLVKMMLEAKGFELFDLGIDASTDSVVSYLQEHEECRFVFLSSLLTTAMPSMEATVAAIGAAGLRDRVTVFVGGAPVTAAFADRIGADYYTEDAGECAALAARVALS